MRATVGMPSGVATTPAHSTALDFVVRRDDLRVRRFTPALEAEAVTLEHGEILMRVDRFAFTSNNITYAAHGDRMSYWEFFPAPEGWGRIPVWGFGTVVRSECDAVVPGERFFGCFPASAHVVMQPANAGPTGFSDGIAHRARLHPLYNQYARTATDLMYDPDHELEQMLWRPLFITSFVIDDLLADNAFFGASAVVLSSASSKTATGLAFLLSERKSGGFGLNVIGLTSAANVGFVEDLACYDTVVAYDDVASLPSGTPVAYVDFSGNEKLRETLHHHFGDGMKYSLAVGYTHWDEPADERSRERLPGAQPVIFFSPAQIKKRAKDWGPGFFRERFAEAWQRFMSMLTARSRAALRVHEESGPEAVERAYDATLEGRVKPDEAYVLSLTS